MDDDIKGCYLPKRYIFVFLAHLGFFVICALRVNLSVALVAMVNATYAHEEPTADPECPGGYTNLTKMKDGDFNWDQNQQGLILSSFFYGYLVTQLPGGILANKYGGKWVFGLGVLFTSAVTFATPIAAEMNFYFLIAVRVLSGLGQGVVFPAMHAMLAKWAPTNEKSTMAVIAYSGAASGTIITLPICSLLCSSTFLGGWPAAFYVFGAAGVLWFVLWSFCVSDSPEDHSSISNEEKYHILESQNGCSSGPETIVVPWLSILSSIRVWAIIIAQFCGGWVYFLVLTGLPSYFKEVLNFNLKEDGLLSALPYIVALFTSIGGGFIADHLQRHNLSTAWVRRIFNSLAFYSSALCLILASFAPCEQYISVIYITLAFGMLSFNNSGFKVNQLDIAPRFGGVLMGITNLSSTVAGCIVPSIVGYFTNDAPTRENYRKVFIISAGLAVVGGTFFNIFASGKEQKWNRPDEQSRGIVNAYDNDGSTDDALENGNIESIDS